ncbi:MAG: GFA family protein [Novosphingobium sp.]|nr:GFA family protein [Novosphingobium sp.]
MSYSGHCSCGSVSARIEGEALGVSQCWCRQCQQTAAGGPTNNAVFPAEAVIIDGSLTERDYVAASGNTVTQAFCPECGTPVLGFSAVRPQIRVFKLGFLDEGHDLRPNRAIWTSEAPDWAMIDPALEQVPGQTVGSKEG